MRPGDPNDPLLRQVLPVAAEREVREGFLLDPVGDGAAALQPGLLQKYAGRVLMVVTGACAIHCRYCFRRNYPYATGAATPRSWEDALARMRPDATIEEVILSGGDPLTLDDSLLRDLVERLEAIPHLQRLRIHTRLGIVLPSRITTELVELLSRTRLQVIVVHHANHAQEIDSMVEGAVSRLQQAGCLQLNQAVLLRGVNDTVADQRTLCERLVSTGVLPYYLHQLDRVAGGAHFETMEALGVQIVAGLRERLPGYMVPRLVREVAGAPHKVVLA